MHMYFTYIYIKGTDRIIFQLINHKKKKKEKRNKNRWKKKKGRNEPRNYFSRVYFPGRNRRTVARKWKAVIQKYTSTRSTLQRNESMSRAANDSVVTRLYSLGTANDILSGVPFFFSFFLFYFSLLFSPLFSFSCFPFNFPYTLPILPFPLNSLFLVWVLALSLSHLLHSLLLLKHERAARKVINFTIH